MYDRIQIKTVKNIVHNSMIGVGQNWGQKNCTDVRTFVLHTTNLG